MRTIQSVRAGWLVGALGACLVIAGAARADVSTERPGSILIFPKVVNDGTRDTIIQVTNTGNMINRLRCFYLDGELGRNGRPICQETDFFLILTKQQPTHWRVSTGREANILSAFGSEEAGLDPGVVPAQAVGFQGALVCVEVNEDERPVSQSKLLGTATLLGRVKGDPSLASELSKYNGIAIAGLAGNNMDGDLKLEAEPGDDPKTKEYNACPATNILNFIPDGGLDPVIQAFGNGGICDAASDVPGAPCNVNDAGACPNGSCDASVARSSVTTNLTVLPCDLDFRNGIPTTVTLQFEVRDEFETLITGGRRNVTCVQSFEIGSGTLTQMRSSLLPQGAVFTQYATVRINATVGGPVLAVAESFHTDSIGNTAASAENLSVEGTDPSAQIKLSDGP